MPKKTILRILVAAPADVRPERKALSSVLKEIEKTIDRDFGVSLSFSYRDIKKFGLENKQEQQSELEECDILIGIFWKRLSAPQKEGQLTVEKEIYTTWRQRERPRVMMFFKQEPYIPEWDEDINQWVNIMKFRQVFPIADIWWPYENIAQFKSLVREQLTKIVLRQYPPSLGLAASRRGTEDLPQTKEINLSVHSDRTIPTLLAALKSPHREIRRIALDELAKAKSERTIQALNKRTIQTLNAVLGDPESDLRLAAVKVLRDMVGEPATVLLARSLKSSYSDVRLAAARALGQIGGSTAVTGLSEAFRHGSNDVRKPAAQALGRIGGKKALSTLVRGLANDNTEVRRNAVDGLALMRGHDAITTLTQIAGDQSVEVRTAAVEGLTEIGRRTTVENLEILDGDRAIVGLVSILKCEHEDVRQTSAKALGEIGSKKALAGLINARNDVSQAVRRQVVSALGEIGSDEALTALVDALNDISSEVRCGAARALGVLDSWDKERIGGRSKEMRTPGPRRKNSARAVAALSNALKDDISEVRKSAVDALGKIANQDAVEALIDSLKSYHADVRFRAAEALGRIGGEPAVGALVSAFQDIGRETALQESGAYIAHEVRSAIGPLRMIAKKLNRTLDRPAEDTTALKEIVGQIIEQTGEVYRLVNQYVTYTKPLSPLRESVNISELVKHSLDEIRTECGMNNVSLSETYGPVPTLNVDPMLVAQALRNVFRNAIEAMRSDGQLEIVVSQESNQVTISISDSGPEISLAHLPRLFELGFTTKMGQQGAGLGLKLARRIIEEGHNGQLVLENIPRGGGVVVTIKLPVNS